MRLIFSRSVPADPPRGMAAPGEMPPSAPIPRQTMPNKNTTHTSTDRRVSRTHTPYAYLVLTQIGVPTYRLTGNGLGRIDIPPAEEDM